MRTYQFYPTLLNDFRYYQTEKTGRGGQLYVTEQSLIDKINKAPYTQSEAMLKGVAFENCLKEQGKYSDGVFDFEPDLLDAMRVYVEGGFWQQFVITSINVDDATVKLYGFSDVIRRGFNIDCKTTSQYEFPGFLQSFQHQVYLLAANDMGIKLHTHRYLISDFRDFFIEDYPYNREEIINDLSVICRDLINFAEQFRHVINNPKIFAP